MRYLVISDTHGYKNNLRRIVEKEQELGDIAKVAFMPQDLEDTLTILAVLSHCKDTIAISS